MFKFHLLIRIPLIDMTPKKSVCSEGEMAGDKTHQNTEEQSVCSVKGRGLQKREMSAVLKIGRLVSGRRN